MSNGLLLRVGIDSASGGWNAPCRADGSFCYIPIADGEPGGRGAQFDHTYDEFSPFVSDIGGVWPGGDNPVAGDVPVASADLPVIHDRRRSAAADESESPEARRGGRGI